MKKISEYLEEIKLGIFTGNSLLFLFPFYPQLSNREFASSF